MPIYSIKAPNGKIYDVKAPEGAKQEDLYAYVQQQLDQEEGQRLLKENTGFFETAGQGLARGAGQLLSTGTDLIPAMVGAKLGFTDYAKEQMQEYAEKEAAREQKYPTLFRSYKEIEGLGDFLKYATETVGEQVPNIATALIPGVGVGSLAGRAAAAPITRRLAAEAAEKGLAKEAAEQYVKQGFRTAITTSPEVGTAVARGQLAGTYLGSYALNAPEIFQNIYEETGGELAPGAAALFSVGAAALDSILPAQLSKQVSGPMRAAIVGKVLEKSGMDKGLVRPLTTAFVKGATTEGLTEGAQEAISIAAEKFVGDNPLVFGSKEWNRIMESAVKGAVAGGAFSTAGRSVEKLRESAEQKRQEAAKAEAEGRAQEAEQLRQEAARIEQEAEAASAQIEAAQRPTTEAEQEAYGVGETTGPYSPVQQFGAITPQEFKKQEAQFKKDQQALKERLAEYTPESFVSEEGKPLVKKGELDLAGLAQQPSPIEQTLQKAESPLDQLQQRGMRKGELGLEQMRAIGWNEDWNALVPNIAELRQPEFRKALTSDVTIPVETRQGIIEAAKKATLPDGTPIVPKSAKYSYPDITSTKVDDLRKISKEVFGVGASASFLRQPPGKNIGEGGIAGLDLANPEHAPQIRAVLEGLLEGSEYRNRTTVEGASEKLERLLSRLPSAEGEQRVTGIDTEAGGAGVEAPVAGGTPGGAAVPAEPTERGGVGAPEVTPRRIVGGKETQPGALAEEEVPVEEKIEDLRSQLSRRKNLTPEEIKALEAEAAASEAPVEPLSSKEQRKAAKEVIGEHYLDPDSHLYLPKYQGPEFDATQRAFAERGDINGLLRNLLDSTRDPAIKQVLRRLRSLNLKTKLVIGDPTGPLALPATDWYYSALAKGVEQLNMKSAPAASWKSAIQGLINKGQVKKEEVEWTGLNDWLDLQPEKVSKESVLDYLNNKGVQVEETMFDVTDKDKAEEIEAATQRFYSLAAQHAPQINPIAVAVRIRTGDIKPQDLPPALQNIAARLVRAQKIKPNTGFAGWASDQGENYRELLLRLPAHAPDLGRYELVNNTTGEVVSTHNTKREAMLARLKYETDNRRSLTTRFREPTPGEARNFYSVHWKEPNVIAHIRLNDRVDADGKKVLYVEEIQSDWAQKGKKEGMGRVPLTFIREGDVPYKGKREFVFVTPNGNGYSGYGNTEAEAREDVYRTLKSLTSDVPAGPFVTKTESWVNLALKRIIALAAEEGYDRVAFINAQQAHQRFPTTEDGRSTRGPFSAFYGEPDGTVVNDAGEVQKDKKPILQAALEKLLPKVDGKKPITSAFATKARELLSFTGQREDAFNAVQNGVPIAIVDARVQRVEKQLEGAGLTVRGDRVVANNEQELNRIVDIFYENFGTQEIDGEIFAAPFNPDNFIYLKPFRTEHVGFDITEGMYLKTTVDKQPLFYNKSGSYDPATDTIMLDPKSGMNAHTFIHEVMHAAVSKVLANSNHPLTKDFEKFFLSIKDRMGGAYGGTNLQEFAAELISNPSFQALLKTIKTPKSESLFMSFLRKIAEFFGFARGTTAFDTGLKFIHDTIDITNGIEASLGERMFLGDGDMSLVAKAGNAMPPLVGRTVESTRNLISKLTESGTLLEEALGAFRLDNLIKMYGKELPSISTLQDVLEKRAAREELDIRGVNKTYTDAVAVQQKFPAQMRRMDEISIEASKKEVDITKPFKKKQLSPQRLERMSPTQLNVFNSAEAKREDEHRLLRDQYLKLPPEVRKVYETIRQEYDEAFYRYRQLLEKAAEGNESLTATLKDEFELNHPLTGYVPFLRGKGDFWLEFVNPENDAPVSIVFDTVRERDQFIAQNLKGIDHRKFQRLEDIAYSANRVPPTHFISKVIAGLQSKGASQEHINSVYQAYLAAFPAESIAKQFMTRRGVEGMNKDLIQGYGDLMVRWTRKLNNSEFLPQIDQALIQLAQEASEQSPSVVAVAKSILRQKDFFHNPTYGKIVHNATALSYYEFMAGNISSGIINLTSLPLMVFPILSGRFGLQAPGALISAMREAAPGNDWASNPKYAALYSALMEHGQLEHTVAREVLEGRRKTTGEFNSFGAKVMELVSIPFTVSEKFNRASTAIAAYNLEYERTKDKEAAIKYALDTVRTAHTSGMAVTGSRWFQTPIGRIFGTFKAIIWQHAFVIARAFYEAAAGKDADVRNAARKQLVAMYGMATVFVGVKGMPFYGATSLIIEMIASLFGDDEKPFNLDDILRENLPMWLYKGFANYLLNAEISSRAALASDIIFRDDPRGIAENGYFLSAMQQAAGPLGSIGINTERSIKYFKNGEIQRGLEAILPSALRNPLKAWRYSQEGVVTRDGLPIMEDINAYNVAMQVVGFAPADLSNRYEMLSSGRQYQRETQERRQGALRLFEMAVKSGSVATYYEAMDRIQKFNDAHPEFAITEESLQRSDRATKAAEKNTIYGIQFNKNLIPELRREIFGDEE